MCVTLTTGTQLTLGSVFIAGIVGSWSSSYRIWDTLSASILVTSFPSNDFVTRVSLQEQGSPWSKSMLFCNTTTLITAVPSHDMNQGCIRTILLSTKMITTSYRFISLQTFKVIQFFFFKYTGNCCSISHTLTGLLPNLKRHYHVQRSFPHLPIRGQRNSVHISHSIYIMPTFKKILWCRHSISVHMSYLSYMTNHYQRARNDHANATKSTKYIQPYRYEKSSIKSENTKNERQHTIPGKHFVLSAIKILIISWHNSCVCTQHSAWFRSIQDTVLQSVCNIIIGSLVGRSCMLLCKLTMCSSLMTVFWRMWLKQGEN